MRAFSSICFGAILLAGALSTTALGDDITTTNNKVYKNVKVTKTDARGVTIAHQKGITRVLFSQMNDDDKKRYGYDPAKEQALLADESERKEAGERAAAEFERQTKAAEERLQLDKKDTYAAETPQRIEDIADFINSTGKYKGRMLVLEMHIDEDVNGNNKRSLRDYIGKEHLFYAFGKQGERLTLNITLTPGVAIPDAVYPEQVTITFICKEGEFRHGNVAVSVTKP